MKREYNGVVVDIELRHELGAIEVYYEKGPEPLHKDCGGEVLTFKEGPICRRCEEPKSVTAWWILQPGHDARIGPIFDEEVALAVAADYFALPLSEADEFHRERAHEPNPCPHGEPSVAGCPECVDFERGTRKFEALHDEGRA